MKVDITKIDLDEGVIQVQVTRSVRVGGMYKIQPTEAYLGIEPGTVHVLEICKLEDMDTSREYYENGKTFMEVEADNLDSSMFKEDMEYLDAMTNGLWVAYKYSTYDLGEWALPIEQFVTHTTHY